MNVIIKYGADLGDFETGTDKVIKDLTKVESKGNDVTATTNEFINTLKSGIAGVTTEKLTKDVDNLNKKLIEAGRDSKYTATELKGISKSANDVGKELGNIAKNNDIKKLATETEGATKKFTSLKAELRALKQSITSGELQGKDLQLATLRAAQLTDELGDMQIKLRTLASDTRVFDTMVEGARLATGAFGLASGAVALFGDENEDLQKALIKLNAVMAISQGLQEISQLTQKETAIGMKLNTAATWAQTAAQTAYNFVVGTSTGLLKLFRLALAGTGIGLLVIALAALIANFDKIKRAIAENSEGFQKFKNVLKFVAPPLYLIIEAIQLLQKNIDKIKATLAGFGAAISTAFSGVGDIVSDGLSGGFSGIVDKFKKLGKDTSDAYTKEYLETEAYNKNLRLNEFAKASQEFKERQIALLKAQGKDTYELEAAQANRSVNILKNALSQKEQEELRGINAIELKLKNKLALSQEESELYNAKSEKITDILKAENERDIFYANRERELAEKALQARKEREQKAAEEKKTRLAKYRQEEEDIAKLFIKKDAEPVALLEDVVLVSDEDNKQLEADVKALIEKLRVDIAELDRLELNKTIYDYFKKGIDDAAKLIDDGAISQGFQKILQSVNELWKDLADDGKIKSSDLVRNLLTMTSGITNLLDAALQRQIENLDKLIDKQRDRVSKAQDIAEEGNSKLLEAEENKLQRLESMRKKDAEKQKAIAIVQAVINTALGVTNALATAPNIIAGIILAALTAAAGAVQIGLIASQTFAKGGEVPMGFIDAPSHAQGGAKFSVKGRKGYVGEYEGGEYIFNKETTTKNKRWFEYINKNRVSIDELFKSHQMSNMGGITIQKDIELNELKNEISELKSIMRGLPERMPRTNVALDRNGFAVSVAHALQQQTLTKANIHD